MPAPKRIGGIRSTKLTKAEWVNVREVQAELKQIVRHMSGEEKIGTVRSADSVVAAGSIKMRDSMRSSQSAAGWPRRLQAATFADTDLDKTRGRRKRTALVGVRTGARTGKSPDVKAAQNPRGVFVEWGKRSGRTVGMSLAAIYERGTGKFPAHPAIRPAVQQTGPEVLSDIANGYREILQQINR